MTSINNFQTPPQNIVLTFNASSGSAADVLYSGSRDLLEPLGFSVRKVSSALYSISIPIATDTLGSFSPISTTRNSIRQLELHIVNTVTPELIAGWLFGGDSSEEANANSETEVDQHFE